MSDVTPIEQDDTPNLTESVIGDSGNDNRIAELEAELAPQMVICP